MGGRKAVFARSDVHRREPKAGAANVEEAQDASSRKDFARRLSIALREAREARYWLRIIRRTSLAPPERLGPLLDEAGEIYAVIHATVRKTRGA